MTTARKPERQCIGTDDNPRCARMIDARRLRCAYCAIDQTNIICRRKNARQRAEKQALKKSENSV